MYRPRIIPVLLLKDKGLVKTTKFKKPNYIGDPINAVRIFNDLTADELVFLDITASRQKRCISPDLVRKIADEAYMPFAVGGGITTIDEVKSLINNGAEKVVVNSSVYRNPELIRKVVSSFGGQSIIAAIDVKKDFRGQYCVYINDGTKKIKAKLNEYISYVAGLGVGEILLNSINQDGIMRGYDRALINTVSSLVDIPVIACGGAAHLKDMVEVVKYSGAHAAAAGSLFVYHSKTKGVLINYPEQQEVIEKFSGQNDE